MRGGQSFAIVSFESLSWQYGTCLSGQDLVKMSFRSASTPDDKRADVHHVENAALPIDSRARVATRATFVVLLVLLAIWIASEFLSALTWAALIAITSWPIYTRLAAFLDGTRSQVVAPLLFTLLTAFALLVPVLLTVHQIAQGSDDFTRWVSQLRENVLAVPGWVAQLPVIGEYLDRWWQANLSNPKNMVEWLRGINLQSITAWTSALGGGLLHRLFLHLITLIALFAMLRSGAWLADRTLAAADLLLGDPGERLASKTADAIRGTVSGLAAAAVIDGTVIGIAYVLAGVPHPLLFAVLTTAFAMVPFGAWVALTAAVLTFLLSGGTLFGSMGLFGFGAGVLLAVDNFIQPALIGGTARLPFLLALIGTLGGLQSLGLVGVFLGPVVMAALVTIWREWVGARSDMRAPG
jgi:predicted PurR-regulated permease PerM